MNLSQQQYQTLFTAVRYYQTYVSLPNNDKELYKTCDDILDEVYSLAYPPYAE